MNKFSVKSKGIFLLESVDYKTALAKAKAHVKRTGQAAYIIALASYKVETTVYKAGCFPINECDSGYRAKHYIVLGEEEFMTNCEKQLKKLHERNTRTKR